MGIFSNKKTDISSGPSIPIDQVQAMKAQGYNNNQIIQSLQRDGYTSSQIFDAISQSEMSQGMTDNMQQPMQQSQMSQGMQDPNMSQGMGNMGMPQGDPYGMQPMQPQGMIPSMGGGSSTEEVIEAIIDEKWNELVKDINKIIDWKQKADNKLAVMEQKITDMREQFDKLHQALIGKIGEYDKNMLNVGAELQAMEKVFSKVLPSFMDNVNELSRITDKMKTPTNNYGNSGSSVSAGTLNTSAPPSKSKIKFSKDDE